MLTAPQIKSAVFRVFTGFPCVAQWVSAKSRSPIRHKISRFIDAAQGAVCLLWNALVPWKNHACRTASPFAVSLPAFVCSDTKARGFAYKKCGGNQKVPPQQFFYNAKSPLRLVHESKQLVAHSCRSSDLCLKRNFCLPSQISPMTGFHQRQNHSTLTAPVVWGFSPRYLVQPERPNIRPGHRNTYALVLLY